MVMDPQELRSKLRGVIAFPVTPFHKDLSLDLDGLRKNMQAILAHPVCAIVAAGGTGEVYSLTPDEYLQVVKVVIEETQGKAPVIAGAAYNAAIGAAFAKEAARAGASGILAFPPYYPHADENGLFEYYRAIGEATPLGLFIYSRDWVHPSAAMVERLASIKTLIAWKEGQGDLRRLQIIMNRLGDRLHWIGGAGDDMVPAYYSTGIRTYTSSISNISCKMSITLHELASKGDLEGLRPLMREFVVPMYNFRARRKGYEVSMVKELMMLLGFAGGPVRPPLENLKEDEIAELRGIAPHWRPWL
jgi:5-dehydro-4-deoxyglucarate dehydratase